MLPIGIMLTFSIYVQVIIWPVCVSRSCWHWGSHICWANMTIQSQYDLEAHLDHIITLLLHSGITFNVSITSVVFLKLVCQ